MNKLTRDQQVSVIAGLTEGVSVRGVERLTGIHRDTILRLMVRVGDACGKLLDESMVDLPCKKLQLDEQWTFVGKKQGRLTKGDDRTVLGDRWLWSCIDEDTRAITSFHLGKRRVVDCHTFVADVAKRMQNRVQISTDGLTSYMDAIEAAFGGNVDYGTIVKSFEAEPVGAGRYGPPKVSSTVRYVKVGNPEGISTSYIERLHLTNRMRIRRMTRLTDAFSKKVENLKAAIQVHYASYNFVKRHKSLDGATPAMALGIVSKHWSVGDLVDLTGWAAPRIPISN